VRILGVALFGAACALVTLGAATRLDAPIGPGRVELRVAAGDGGTRLHVPPLGDVTARTHRWPLRIDARLDRFDAADFRIADEEERTGMRRDVAADVRDLMTRLVVRALLAAAVAGALGALLIARRRWTTALTGAVGATAVVGSLLALTATSFQPEALASARFDGPLTRAPAVLAALGGDAGAGRAATLGRQVDALMATAGPAAANGGPLLDDLHDDVRILHVSDLHSNATGATLALTLAERFDVDAVLDTGDLTSFGYPVESEIGALLARADVPWLFVPGNHDSRELRASLGARPGITVVDSDVVDVKGVRILGVGDPTFTADNVVSAKEAAATKRDAAPLVAAMLEREQPDVLAVHDPLLAGDAAGLVPVVASGHRHRRAFHTVKSTVFVGVGSTGAGGVGVYLTEKTPAYEAEVLRFSAGRLVAVDYLRLDGDDGDFRADRRILPAGRAELARMAASG
jgi:predicted phosphodiesterase